MRLPRNDQHFRVTEYLNRKGSDPGGPPDFDGDGAVGVLDLLTLLVNWGPCA